MSTGSRYLKSEFSHLEPREALQQPINVLLGSTCKPKPYWKAWKFTAFLSWPYRTYSTMLPS